MKNSGEKDLHDLIEEEYFGKGGVDEAGVILNKHLPEGTSNRENVCEGSSEIDNQYFRHASKETTTKHGPGEESSEECNPAVVPQVSSEASQMRQPSHSAKAMKELWSLIPDVAAMKRDELIEFLATQCIADEHEDILVLNKPYGLVTKGGYGQRRSLFGLLPHLASRLKTDRLFPLNRLDRQVTGCVLLAKGKDARDRLAEQQKRYGFEKEYLCIVRGVPRETAGTVGLPLAHLKSGSGAFRVFPALNRRAGAKLAETDYLVLSSTEDCALIRARFNKGQKHQVRCHLGFVLDTPVIGDHKYSDVVTMRRQTLPGTLLTRLGLPGYAAANMPMFMHGSRVCLPKIASGDLRVFESRIPSHFIWLLGKLKLTV